MYLILNNHQKKPLPRLFYKKPLAFWKKSIKPSTLMGGMPRKKYAVSKKEFLLRIGTCKKEAKETMYWFRMIAAADQNSKQAARPLWQEAKELHLIFASIWRKK